MNIKDKNKKMKILDGEDIQVYDIINIQVEDLNKVIERAKSYKEFLVRLNKGRGVADDIVIKADSRVKQFTKIQFASSVRIQKYLFPFSNLSMDLYKAERLLKEEFLTPKSIEDAEVELAKEDLLHERVNAQMSKNRAGIKKQLALERKEEKKRLLLKEKKKEKKTKK